VGLSLYVAASAACAAVGSLNGLIVCRSLQAVGGSAAGAVATAIVKDVYSGKKRESVLAIVQSMVLISPAVAPILGAFLLKAMSWRGVFWVLTGIGGLALLGSLVFEETIAEKTSGVLLHSLGRLVKVLQNRGFTLLLILFSIGSISSTAFIASSTYIYQDGFHLSQQVYSYYFSLNAIGMIIAPLIYLRLSRRFHAETIIRAAYLVIAASGFLVCCAGNFQPWTFAVSILPASIASNCLRPPSANMMLEQQKGDTGAVSSLMGCVGLLMGSLGLQIISLPWGNTIIALGVMTLGTAVISLAAWPFIITRTIRLPSPRGKGQQERNLETDAPA